MVAINGFDIDKAVRRIKLLMGGQVVRLEICDDDIKDILELAYDKIKPYITDTKYHTYEYAAAVDVSNEGFIDIIKAWHTTQNIISTQRLFDFETIKLGRSQIVHNVLATYPLINDEINFRYIPEEGMLYMDSESSYQGLFTVEGTVCPELADLKDERAKQWIFNYALANVKLVLGRIRSKYRPQGIPVELDGDTLLNEAQTEIQQLEQDLTEKQFGPFKILRDNGV